MLKIMNTSIYIAVNVRRRFPMSVMASHNKPGVVFVQQVRAGRRKHFGTTAIVEGHLSICIGYTDDGTVAVFAPIKQLKHIRGAVVTAEKRLSYRALKFLMDRYERKRQLV
jgi:hypothetical protein